MSVINPKYMIKMEEQLVFSKSKHDEINQQLDMERIPNHIAIIMDGNGRWAQKRHLPRVAGHKQGMQTVKKITIAASELGVKVLSLYAFFRGKSFNAVACALLLNICSRSCQT